MNNYQQWAVRKYYVHGVVFAIDNSVCQKYATFSVSWTKYGQGTKKKQRTTDEQKKIWNTTQKQKSINSTTVCSGWLDGWIGVRTFPNLPLLFEKAECPKTSNDCNYTWFASNFWCINNNRRHFTSILFFC